MGKIAGIPVHISPTWFLVAAVITVAFAPIVRRQLPEFGSGAYAIALTFAVLLYLSVLFHELSHALTARALGLPVRGITLHFLGGYTEIERNAPTPGRDLVVSVAGPLVSLAAAGLAYVASRPVDQPVAQFLLLELAWANLLVGVFNLLPALPLDGGHMLRAAVWRVTGREHTGTVVAARAGQVLAVLVVLVPFLLAGGRPSFIGVVWSGLVAVLLWTGATQALAVGRVRSRLPRLDLQQMTRRAAPVAPDVPLAEALRQAQGSRGARTRRRRLVGPPDGLGQRGVGRCDPSRSPAVGSRRSGGALASGRARAPCRHRRGGTAAPDAGNAGLGVPRPRPRRGRLRSARDRGRRRHARQGLSALTCMP